MLKPTITWVIFIKNKPRKNDNEEYKLLFIKKAIKLKPFLFYYYEALNNLGIELINYEEAK